MAEVRESDIQDSHERDCWKSHHEHSSKITVLEVNVANLQSLANHIVEKHENTTSTLDRLALLFERFLSNFEDHTRRVEQIQTDQSNKLHEAEIFQTRVLMTWKVVAIIVTIVLTITGIVYTIGHDSGLKITTTTTR